jgi:hypothetical protein
MDNDNYEVKLKQATLNKLHAEISQLHSEREKIELEKNEYLLKNKKKWWHLKAVSIIQSVIAGIVAGGLIASFGLDHFLKIIELNKQSQQASIIETAKLLNEREKLQQQQEENRARIDFLRNENEKIRENAIKTLKTLPSMRNPLGTNTENTVRSNVIRLKKELIKVKKQAEQSKNELKIELDVLVKSQETTDLTIKENWFPIIASPANTTDLIGRLEKLKKKQLDYPIHVYKTIKKQKKSIYAITFGGYLTKEQALTRINYAKDKKISKDAYLWSSNVWGDNIIDNFPSHQ